MKLEQILPQGWQNPRIWPSATHIFVAHQSIWATDAPPEWYAASPCWLPTTYSQPIHPVPADMREDARSVVWVRAETEDGAILNQYGHDLRKYLSSGWGDVHEWCEYVAIDQDGEVYEYQAKPFPEDEKWNIRRDLSCEYFLTAPIAGINWHHLIWQRPC